MVLIGEVTPGGEVDAVGDPGALTGAMIAGRFGIAWALWGGPGLGDGSAAAVRVAAIATGVLIALVGGGALLGATGHSEYTIAWFAGVVGIHFVVFGQLFWAGFHWLGAAFARRGGRGGVVGFAGAGSGAIRAVSGLIAAMSLFAAGGWTVLATQAGLRA